MVLNSSRLIPRLSRSYCGMVLYFANSACQSASPSGGTAPVTGFHSTIESPDSVSRVAPPTNTMANTSDATHHSHTPMARDAGAGLRVPASAPHNASWVLDGCHRTVMGPLTLVMLNQHDPSRTALCRPHGRCPMLKRFWVLVAVAWPPGRGLVNARRPFCPALCPLKAQWFLQRSSSYSIPCYPASQSTTSRPA